MLPNWLGYWIAGSPRCQSGFAPSIGEARTQEQLITSNVFKAQSLGFIFAPL